MRDTFVDPKTGDSYEWDIGHTDEEPNGKSRQISESANTGNTGLVKQQGDTQPLVNKYSGTILTLDQFEEMWHWFNLCETQTVIFKDFAGEEFEVIITAFLPQRQRTVKNPRDFANCPFHYWTYSITMEVVRVISGALEGVTP